MNFENIKNKLYNYFKIILFFNYKNNIIKIRIFI